MVKGPLLLLLVLLGSAVATCPDCSSWQGATDELCGFDGVTHASTCELLIALCQEGVITLNSDADLNTLPVEMMVSSYIANMGPCSDDGGGGNCPNCTGIISPRPVCDSSLAEYTSSCEMAQMLCSAGVIAYTDGVNFTSFTEDDYFGKVYAYISWEGKCSGPCPTGYSSRTGNYGPCRKCSPGTHAPTEGSTGCLVCPEDTYQPDYAAASCINCPNGTDTLNEGSTNVTQCLEDCVQGHFSNTGKAPCTRCSTGTWAPDRGSLSCKTCGAGNYTDGVTCDGCPMGSFSGSNTAPAECDTCPIGHFANSTGLTSCFSCEPGTYGNETGMPACRMCGKGSYNNQTAATDCVQCSVGTYQVELGQNFCFACPRGTYQPNTGAETCQECPKGYYQEAENGVACRKCPSGQTTDSAGSVSRQECHFTSCEAGRKVVIENGRIRCEDCPRGFYQNARNQTSCKKCDWDSYQDSEGSSSCNRCPQNHVTYTTGGSDASDCEGPAIQLATGQNMGGQVITLYDRRTQLPGSFLRNVQSFRVLSGDWYLFSENRYNGYKMRLREGDYRSNTNNENQNPRISHMSSRNWYALRPAVSSVMCFVENGLRYIGYRSKTQHGVTCQNWQSNYPHRTSYKSGRGVGNHNYCRNPDNDANGPWCYTTDPDRSWDYCGVPKCKWNVDCYTELGQDYRGFSTQTVGNSYNCNDWYSNFPHPHSYDSDYNVEHYGVGHHRYCRNPNPGSDNRPWCYTTYFFKRWAYCDVPKCEFSGTDYFVRKHHPKAINLPWNMQRG